MMDQQLGILRREKVAECVEGFLFTTSVKYFTEGKGRRTEIGGRKEGALPA
jgi:hypothetical protein